MNRLLGGLGWLLLGAGILVIAFAAIALYGAFFGPASGAVPDARGMTQGIAIVALIFVGIPFSTAGGLLVLRAKRAATSS